ncbi:lysosomal endosomal membrane protein, putative [Bodo saltans]|uniref:Phospholipase B-like n=1 Tax=Bodo saltans TaxID=75058 RepID=A0A0S4JJ45_BODSA|nr:lysosomal endosomal membrane protein, putative [Bodo saltans]|eukprot:CUG90179.1 lysosomal endosomal membrane protein, putative [Bodo saltans]
MLRKPLIFALLAALAFAAPTPDILSYDAAFNFTWSIWDVVDNATNTSSLHVLPPNTTWVNQTCIGLVVFNASMYDQGWDYLQVVPNSSTVNMSNYYVGGYGEGYVTHDRIDFVYDSMGIYKLSPKAQTWVNEHIAYMEEQSSLQNSTFWVQVSNLLALMQGIADGYSARAKELGTRELNFTQIFYLNFNTEYGDVETAVDDELKEGVHFRATDRFQAQVKKRQYRDQHCSALIKVTSMSKPPLMMS